MQVRTFSPTQIYHTAPKSANAEDGTAAPGCSVSRLVSSPDQRVDLRKPSTYFYG